MQSRVALSKSRSNFTGKLTAFFSQSAAPAGEKFRTVQSKEVPLPRMIAESEPLRTVNPNEAGQRSDDYGQLLKAS
jgi:hypothetical protein